MRYWYNFMKTMELVYPMCKREVFMLRVKPILCLQNKPYNLCGTYRPNV